MAFPLGCGKAMVAPPVLRELASAVVRLQTAVSELGISRVP